MRIGIDLGGTKIEGILLDADGKELARDRVATPAGNYDATVDAVASVVLRLERSIAHHRGIATVGIGIPGTLSPSTSLIKNANSTCLIGKPLDADLAKAIGRPVRLANDANCFTVSEATDGAASAADVVFGIILGTGVGGGIVIDGKVMAGRNAIAGEWGHNALPWPDNPQESPGPDCYCGKQGCIETFLSGPALADEYRRSGASARSTQPWTAREIASQAPGIDSKRAEKVLERYEHRLARALASVINIIDPDIIVLGGGLSNIKRIYQNVPRLWQEWVFSDVVTTPLVANQHGDSSGVRGAAWLWPT